MKIAVIGSGNVGSALGTRWAQNGHDVLFGTRKDPSALKDVLAKAGPKATAAPVAEAVRDAEVVVLATPWNATQAAVTAEADFTGKIVIDATNPLLPDLSGLALPGTESGAEMVAQWIPRARVVKAFNTVGSNVMQDTSFPEGKVVMFYCGDDAEAKRTVAQLITELGFDAQDAGPLSQARVLEPFALLWISLAVKYGYGREIAFQLLRRSV